MRRTWPIPSAAASPRTSPEALTDIGTKLVFFRLEINKLDDADLAAKQKDPALAKYGPWLRDLRVFRPHQLSDELEKALHEKYVVGRAAWSRLFDETIARLRYPFRNEMLTEPQILDKLSSKDAAVRKDAAKSFGKVQGDNIAVFSLVTNTLAKDKEIEDRWRKYPRPQSRDEPRQRGRGRGGRRARLGGEGGLSAAGAPLLQAQGQVVRRRQDAVLGPQRAAARATTTAPSRGTRREKTVLDAYRAFSPELADVGRKFFGTGWIDAPARPGKSPGAFAHPDRAVGASLSAAQLPGQGARRHDPGARAGPRRAPGAGGAAGRADGRHAADAWPRPPRCSARC